MYLFEDKKLTKLKQQAPPKRYHHTFTVSVGEEKAYSVGGLQDGCLLNEIIEFDLTNFNFKKLRLDET